MGNEIFAERLKEEREKRGWTQEYMANLLGIKIGTLSGYERKYRRPDMEMTQRIADLLGVSIDYLLGRGKLEKIPCWEKEKSSSSIELEKFIYEQPNLKLFGESLNEETKDDLLLILKAVWEVIRKERAAR